MNFNLFKIDTWWKAVFILGIIACVGASTTSIEFLERKHLMGFGIGMILIGISHWIAWKTINSFEQGGILSCQIIKHNFFTVILLITGIVLTSLFGFFIIKGLI
uniref:hypothetical protein n=1 Tax=Flavobacterium sp. TaxID=239 RepID=UPI00159AF9B3|nr:hypothetical protein [Flavobacterium sp.]QJS06630.1 hypothetical protein [Flavobacterium sp.]